MGSNPTPSDLCGYNYLRTDEKPRVTGDEPKRNYQLINVNKRGGYDLTPDAYVWHPNPAVCRMWAQQHEASK